MFQPDQVNSSEFSFWFLSANFYSVISFNIAQSVLGHAKTTLNSPVSKKLLKMQQVQRKTIRMTKRTESVLQNWDSWHI